MAHLLRSRPLRCLYWVQPYIGVGPQNQAEMVARAVQKRLGEIELLVLMGGRSAPFHSDNVEWIQLAPLRLHPLEFRLIDEQGDTPSQETLEARVQICQEALKRFNPDVVMMHNFMTKPNSHAPSQDEVSLLIDFARRKGIPVVSSVMDCFQGFEDIPESVLDRYLNDALNQVDQFFVRGSDKELLWKSCSTWKGYPKRFTFVGYPTPEHGSKEVAREDRIVVSGGGSELAHLFFTAAIQAANSAEGRFKDSHWNFLIGPNYPGDVDSLIGLAGGNDRITFHSLSSRREYLDLLSRARVSLSECGQNTFVDLELSRVPAVVVPYEGGGRFQEQLYRAQYLSTSGRGSMVRERDLAPELLLQAMVSAEDAVTRSLSLTLGGAEQIVTELLGFKVKG